ncbi:cue domain-containing protein [Ophiostoma piceae UAMH 11346]|uniref:Cue domain-containing protein n=1 Tax=Ophiostoma piceae (strain UAMH 11346) TaxID=1262450 RepID=S3BQH1_OPHP1|nr:cue domain-containing protein [Ophiostoma piceae UAMH 11346]
MDLPPLAPYPETAVQQQIPVADWPVFVDSWLSLAGGYLGLADEQFGKALKDGTLEPFLLSYIKAQALTRPRPDPASPALLASEAAAALKKTVFLLTARTLISKTPPAPAAFLQWDVLADFAKVYGRHRVSAVLSGSSKTHHLAAVSVGVAEASLSSVKKFLIQQMEQRVSGDLRAVEDRLQRLNHLVSAWPAAGAQLLAGSDFLDALVGCYTIMNPPLRLTIITTTYLSLLSLTEPPTPRFSQLSDVLYSLRAAASDHKEGPLNVNDSLVAELVSATPILQQLKQRTEAANTATNRILPILRDLETYRKVGSGGITVPQRRIKARPDKGKGAEPPDASGPASTSASASASTQHPHLHPHKLSQISQIQDLFPDLGSAFIAKLLDEYSDDSEQVIAHLLEDDLPPHLNSLDRTQNLSDYVPTHMAPHATPPLPPTTMPDLPPPDADLPKRANVFDSDDLAQLNKKTAKLKLHFGKQKSGRTADDVLRERTDAPRKAAIMSALAAFDADDDERDDTYDAVDIGGAVEPESTGGDDALDANDLMLFAAFQTNIKVFDRDAVARRSEDRRRLREETNMTDEVLEGWALMLQQNPLRRRRLEAKIAMSGGVAGFAGGQNEVARTSWRQTDDDGEDGEGSGRGGYRGRGGRGRGGFNRPPRGNVDGPSGDRDTEAARRRKESNKGSRANHNRRDQRARKMGRGM